MYIIMYKKRWNNWTGPHINIEDDIVLFLYVLQILPLFLYIIIWNIVLSLNVYIGWSIHMLYLYHTMLNFLKTFKTTVLKDFTWNRKDQVEFLFLCFFSLVYLNNETTRWCHILVDLISILCWPSLPLQKRIKW